MSQKNLLIGGTGFAGYYLKNVFKDVEIMNRNNSNTFIDIRNYKQLYDYVKNVNPSHIIHLAAQSSIPDSFINPQKTFDINFFGTLNLLNILKEINFRGRLLYIGSGQVYGKVDSTDLPLTEERALKPINPYAVSKLAAEALCYQWSQSSPFEIIISRPFNHIGPRQSEHFVISNFAKQIIEIKKGLRPNKIKVGNIDVYRDFTDVRDVAEAYKLLLDKGINGEAYNICSGKGYYLKGLLAKMMQIVPIEAEIVEDAKFYRPSEYKWMYGSYMKINKHTNWKPEIPIEKSLEDILEYYQRKLFI